MVVHLQNDHPNGNTVKFVVQNGADDCSSTAPTANSRLSCFTSACPHLDSNQSTVKSKRIMNEDTIFGSLTAFSVQSCIDTGSIVKLGSFHLILIVQGFIDSGSFSESRLKSNF